MHKQSKMYALQRHALVAGQKMRGVHETKKMKEIMVTQNILFFEASQKIPQSRGRDNIRPVYTQSDLPMLPKRAEDFAQEIDVQDRRFLSPKKQKPTVQPNYVSRKRNPENSTQEYDQQALRECLLPQLTRTKSQPILTQMGEKNNYKQAEISRLIQNLQKYLIYYNKEKPDILCLNETFLKQHHKVNLPFYTLIRQDRPDTQKYHSRKYT